MNLLLMAMLVVHPVVDEPTDLRMVAVGVDGEVTWTLDGDVVARTTDREAATVHVDAGSHELIARSDTDAAWEIMARPEPRGEGAAYVPAWTAKHEPTPAQADGLRSWLWLIAAGVAAAALVVVPRVRDARRGRCEAAINPLAVADACTSTPGASRSTRITASSARSSGSPSSDPMSGGPSRTRIP